jgi:hypothetical protein
MAISWAITPPSGVENTFDITASTDVRDVSSMLDAVYVADTPFVNRIGWGGATHNKIHEWITDSIGYGYVILSNGEVVLIARLLSARPAAVPSQRLCASCIPERS